MFWYLSLQNSHLPNPVFLLPYLPIAKSLPIVGRLPCPAHALPNPRPSVCAHPRGTQGGRLLSLWSPRTSPFPFLMALHLPGFIQPLRLSRNISFSCFRDTEPSWISSVSLVNPPHAHWLTPLHQILNVNVKEFNRLSFLSLPSLPR